MRLQTAVDDRSGASTGHVPGKHDFRRAMSK